MKVMRFKNKKWIEVDITDIDNFFNDVVWSDCPFAFTEYEWTGEIYNFLDKVEQESAKLDEDVFYFFDSKLGGRDPEQIFIFYNYKMITFTEYHFMIENIYNDMIKLKNEIEENPLKVD